MSVEEPIKLSLQEKFRTEKLRRVIKECDDISMLKQIAFELLNLNLQKTAIFEWSARIAIKAEELKLSKKKVDYL